MPNTIALPEATRVPSLSESVTPTAVIAPVRTSVPAFGDERSSLHRVRDRLAEHGLTLALNAQPNGWTWDIPESPLHTRRCFDSINDALDHADAYTAAWYAQLI